jgi:hypothetical protein
MANQLEIGGPPPAPDIQAPPQPDSNPLQSGASAAAAPAPTHAQTVAALRHFGAIKEELGTLLKNPALGKSSIKSAIIDGTTKLVAERIISPAQAVMQLGKVPEAPLEQRKWVQMMMAQTIQAANAVLDHHAAGQHGPVDFAQDHPGDDYNPDDHMSHMDALMGQYSKGAR